jgi:hypothetical protein
MSFNTIYKQMRAFLWVFTFIYSYKPAHILLKALICPNCIVIITKIIRSLDALSISPFLVIDDNTIWLSKRDVCIQQSSEKLPLNVCIVN